MGRQRNHLKKKGAPDREQGMYKPGLQTRLMPEVAGVFGSGFSKMTGEGEK